MEEGHKATLPNHGTLLFTGSVETVARNRNPGPGDYEVQGMSRQVARRRGGYFSKVPRETAPPVGTSPSPQHYNIRWSKAMGNGAQYSFAQNNAYEAPPKWVTGQGMEPFVGFGHQCTFYEHVCYGKCLDQGCSTRAEWEKTNARLLAGDKDSQELRGKLSRSLADLKSMLHYAVIREEMHVINRILLGGFDPDTRDDQQRTALHWAAHKGNYRVTNRLLQNDLYPYVTPKGYSHDRVAPSINVQVRPWSRL